MPGDFEQNIASLVETLAADGDRPEIRATHASVVLLQRERVYKLKRHIDLGFLDYSTLEKRRHACEEEVRLNRPRAEGIYLGARPIVREGGRVSVGGAGEIVDWAVEMRRLPDEACLLRRVERALATRDDLAAVGRALAGHLASAQSSEAIAAYASLDRVKQLALDNLAQSTLERGSTLAAGAASQLEERLLRVFEALGPAIEGRRRRQIAREIHGDLRLDHVYLLPSPGGPDKIVFVDCIEFSEALRCGDPVSDIAFLAMDLAVRGEDALADAAREAFFEASGDSEGRSLLPFYESYRSAVRGKVAGILLRDPALPEAERASALLRARRHWLFALDRLCEGEIPRLIGVGGLPGVGKSTLARALAHKFDCELIRSDVVRKEHGDTVLYTEQAKDEVYEECLRRASALVFEGKRVIVDASFGRARWRSMLRQTARDLGVRARYVECALPDALALARIEARTGDPSDADARVYAGAKATFEGSALEEGTLSVDTSGDPDATAAELGERLRAPR